MLIVWNKQRTVCSCFESYLFLSFYCLRKANKGLQISCLFWIVICGCLYRLYIYVIIIMWCAKETTGIRSCEIVPKFRFPCTYREEFSTNNILNRRSINTLHLLKYWYCRDRVVLYCILNGSKGFNLANQFVRNYILICYMYSQKFCWIYKIYCIMNIMQTSHSY